MIVKIADLSEEVKELGFSESASELNDLINAAPGADEQKFDGDVGVKGEIYCLGTDVYLSGGISGLSVNVCRRCAEEFEAPVERDFKFLLIRRSGEPGEPEDDTGLDHYEGDEIDLSPLVKEQAMLALDGVTLCSEGCKGLCANCGANLNSEACRCA